MTQLLPGIAIGHWHDDVALTGCTVLLPTAGTMRAGVHVGGGAPATRETDLLAPTATVGEIHALLLTGGSAFGLDAAGGVMRYLRERNIGVDMRVARVPIVPAAAIFDLGLGTPDTYPDPAAGYAACQAARPDEMAEGNVGAGCGATVGKVLGRDGSMKGGLGLASSALPSSLAGPAHGAGRGRRSPGAIVMGALAVVNAVGDVRAADGTIIAGARRDNTFVDSAALLRANVTAGVRSSQRASITTPRSGNTTLVAIATNARLDKLGLTRLARQAHDGLALAISPVHTAHDGDIVFALSTGEAEGTSARGPRRDGGDEADPTSLAALAVELVAQAVRRAVLAAVGAGGVPAIRDSQLFAR